LIDEYIKRWIIKATEDYKVAKHELNLDEDEIATGAVCFHCQQCVEKLLKAYLISKNVDFRKIHDLKLLLKFCVEQDPDFHNVSVGNLTFYAVEVRYPDEYYFPSVDEAKESFDIISKIKDFVFEKLKINEETLKT